MKNLLKAGRVATLIALALAPVCADARDFTAGNVVVQDPWARATPPGAQVAGGYVTILNKGSTAETLTGGSFDASAHFELHDMTTEGGIMKMRPSGPVTIPPGGTLTLSPSGRHIMFTGLKRGLAKGETVAGAFTFEHAGSVPVQFEVEGIGAKGPTATKPETGAQDGKSMPGMKMD